MLELMSVANEDRHTMGFNKVKSWVNWISLFLEILEQSGRQYIMNIFMKALKRIGLQNFRVVL